MRTTRVSPLHNHSDPLLALSVCPTTFSCVTYFARANRLPRGDTMVLLPVSKITTQQRCCASFSRHTRLSVTNVKEPVDFATPPKSRATPKLTRLLSRSNSPVEQPALEHKERSSCRLSDQSLATEELGSMQACILQSMQAIRASPCLKHRTPHKDCSGGPQDIKLPHGSARAVHCTPVAPCRQHWIVSTP